MNETGANVPCELGYSAESVTRYMNMLHSKYCLSTVPAFSTPHLVNAGMRNSFSEICCSEMHHYGN